jgi:hypothetical protein
MSVNTALIMGQKETAAATVGFRLGGIGGLVFAATLVAQNIIRASEPGLGAGPAQVSAYFLHHRWAALVPLGLFPVGMFAIFFFVAAIWTKADGQESRWWANVGALGATSIAALFAIVNITEIVLTAKAAQLAASPDLVQLLWAVHAAAFGLDLAAIAVTLIGLSRAAASVGILPSWMAVAAVPGAVCLFLPAVFTVAVSNGSPWFRVGIIGFIVWIGFVVVSSVSLLRQREVS